MTEKYIGFLLMLFLTVGRAYAAILLPQDECQQAVLTAEHAAQIPDRLLIAVSLVESGRRVPDDGSFGAWPWTINAQGRSYFYETKAEAVAAARSFQAAGISSIDVGCLQINLHHHPDAFASLEDAFDPQTNANYGAHFLSNLHNQLQAWTGAVGAYHSMTPGLGEDYARKVLALWAKERGGGLASLANELPKSVPEDSSMPIHVPSPVSRPFSPTMISYAPPPRIIRHNFAGGSGGMGSHGRDLASYRAAPVRLAWQR